MNNLNKKAINVVIFSGGRGASSLVFELNKHPQLDISIIVNAYDDGLSTGQIRNFIPGMLGPSDLRKNISTLLSPHDAAQKSLKELLEFRLSPDCRFTDGITLIKSLANENYIEEHPVSKLFLNTTVKTSIFLRKCFSAFNNYAENEDKNCRQFDFADCAIGNIIIAGSFLLNKNNFNHALDDLQKALSLRGHIYNVTDGENLILVALKSDGAFLHDEASIVAKQNEKKITDIYLLREYLTPVQQQYILSLPYTDRVAFLKKQEIFPNINPRLRSIISSADLIIYGPGTQHSSLFPSYLTKEIGHLIASNTNAEKIFISNILKDNEIQTENATSLTQKLYYYLNQKNSLKISPEQLTTKFFFQYTDANNSSEYVDFDTRNFPFPKENVVLANWEAGPGKHNGGRLLDEIITIVNTKLMLTMKAFPHTVSIVVPCLNEERTVKKVLHDLCLLDFGRFGLGKEIIFVDGGSTDNSVALAQSEKQVKVLPASKSEKRGEAIRRGIQAATGNFIVFFPSDGEYETNDIYSIVKILLEGEFKAIFGSRALKSINLREQVRKIYKGNRILYFLSMYGGWFLSMCCLVLYNRFITDTLTSLKAFDAKTLKGFKLSCKRVDLDLEIIAKLMTNDVFIVEIPVNYKPRTIDEGKKITLLDGLFSVLALFKIRYSKKDQLKILPHKNSGQLTSATKFS